MEKKVVMVTGHRPERLGDKKEKVAEWINEKLNELKPDECVNGMAQGADQIFALCCINNGYPIVNVYPHRRKFCVEEELINLEAKQIIFYADKYNVKNYTERDKMMVDMSNIVLAVWDGIPQGGTYQTLKYAEEQGKKVIYFPWGGKD